MIVRHADMGTAAASILFGVVSCAGPRLTPTSPIYVPVTPLTAFLDSEGIVMNYDPPDTISARIDAWLEDRCGDDTARRECVMRSGFECGDPGPAPACVATFDMRFREGPDGQIFRMATTVTADDRNDSCASFCVEVRPSYSLKVEETGRPE